MKNALPALLLFLPALAHAQECGSGRYTTYNFFSAIDSIPAVEFGSNTAVGGGAQTLRMDIYAPADDPVQERPVVVLAFGGSFIAGSRADMAPWGGMLARLGYVAVAIDYRVGFFFPNTNTTMHAVQRCVHDMRGAVRFLRKTAAEDGNPYDIDPDRIIVCGVSAGAIGALQLTYMNEPSELPAPLVADSAALGGMEGTSGPLGYSSVPMACVSLSGALMDTTWVHPGDQPYCGIHETGDQVVPCFTEEAYALGFPTGIVVSGDHDISLRMDHIGLPHCYLEYPGNGHVGYLDYDPVNSTALVVQFLAGVVCGQEPACGSATASVARLPDGGEGLALYPLPAGDQVTLELPEAAQAVLLDGQGRAVWRRSFTRGKHTIATDGLPNGLYLLRAEGTAVRTARLVVAH